MSNESNLCWNRRPWVFFCLFFFCQTGREFCCAQCLVFVGHIHVHEARTKQVNAVKKHTHTNINTYISTYLHTYIHTYIHTFYMPTYIQKGIYTYNYSFTSVFSKPIIQYANSLILHITLLSNLKGHELDP